MPIVSLLGLGRWAAASVLVAVPSAVGAGMGLGMTIIRYHYLTDAVGGFCVAVAVVLSLAVLLDRLPSAPPRGRTPAGGVGGEVSKRIEALVRLTDDVLLTARTVANVGSDVVAS